MILLCLRKEEGDGSVVPYILKTSCSCSDVWSMKTITQYLIQRQFNVDSVHLGIRTEGTALDSDCQVYLLIQDLYSGEGVGATLLFLGSQDQDDLTVCTQL